MAKDITIVGAGLSGLLAACMMPNRVKEVVEAQPGLPNNHSAVLRFRSSIVGDALGIPFKRVQMLKAVEAWRNPIADALSYSTKTNGVATIRSIASADGGLAERYVAPPDLIQQMFDKAKLMGVKFRFGAHIDDFSKSAPCISTVPMPTLARSLEARLDPPRADFRFRRGVNISAVVEGVDAYCSLYVPHPKYPGARISVTGDKVVVECYSDLEMARREPEGIMGAAIFRLGLSQRAIISERVKALAVSDQDYGKILPISESLRRSFIMRASQLGVYSLGRFATWRPGLLLDDVVNDVRVIERLIDGEGEYQHRLKG